MSTQSGITASQDLLSTFQAAESDVLLVKISPDSTQLIQDSTPEISGDLPQIFPKLQSYIESIHPHPLYILLAVGDEYAFISFIPDVAHIRDKMLYASTKNTLLQELGGGKINKDLIFAWSELDELTLDHFNASKPKHNNEDVMTLEEKYLKEINSLQDLSFSGRKLASMDNGTQLLFKIDDDLESSFSSLDSQGLVTFVIDLGSEHFKLVSSTSVDLSSLISKLETSTPQFAVYSYLPGKVALIYTCPSGSKVKDRMVYASNKQGLVNHLKGLFGEKGMVLDKVLDVGDADELELDQLKEEETVTKSASSLRFNKPRGPRRR